MSANVVYPYAPIVLVALEIRHTGADALTGSEQKAVKRALGRPWPFQRPGKDLTFELNGTMPSPRITEEYSRYFSRDTGSAVVLKKDATSLETTRYGGWESFRKMIQIVLDARQEIAPLPGYDRIGMRYMNEIRVDVEGTPDWSEWIHSALLGPRLPEPIDLELADWQSFCTFGPSDGQTLVMRYGSRTGYALDPNAELKRPKLPPPGPFFLFDCDSSWQPPDDIPEFNPKEMLGRCDDLHEPVHTLFESLITDTLRRKVLNGEPELV